MTIGRATQMPHFQKEFEKEQIDEIIFQAIRRSERYKKLKNVGKK